MSIENQSLLSHAAQQDLFEILDTLFAQIDFNCRANAKLLNVIYARVKKPKQKKGDSHNLGKTTLIALIDFLLLKDITSTDHFLAKHSNSFREIRFFPRTRFG